MTTVTGNVKDIFEQVNTSASLRVRLATDTVVFNGDIQVLPSWHDIDIDEDNGDWSINLTASENYTPETDYLFEFSQDNEIYSMLATVPDSTESRPLKAIRHLTPRSTVEPRTIYDFIKDTFRTSSQLQVQSDDSERLITLSDIPATAETVGTESNPLRVLELINTSAETVRRSLGVAHGLGLKSTIPTGSTLIFALKSNFVVGESSDVTSLTLRIVNNDGGSIISASDAVTIDLDEEELIYYEFTTIADIHTLNFSTILTTTDAVTVDLFLLYVVSFSDPVSRYENIKDIYKQLSESVYNSLIHDYESEELGELNQSWQANTFYSLLIEQSLHDFRELTILSTDNTIAQNDEIVWCTTVLTSAELFILGTGPNSYLRVPLADNTILRLGRVSGDVSIRLGFESTVTRRVKILAR